MIGYFAPGLLKGRAALVTGGGTGILVIDGGLWLRAARALGAD